jgi:hypothetical protein
MDFLSGNRIDNDVHRPMLLYSIPVNTATPNAEKFSLDSQCQHNWNPC